LACAASKRLRRAATCHLPAAFCESSARLHALIHVTHLFAVLRARIAYVRARSADARVQWRTAQHEVRGGATDLRAIHHQPEMRRLDVLAARFETMVHRFMPAGLIALKTFVDALLHLRIHLMCHV
jgi:hypothetical protein